MYYFFVTIFFILELFATVRMRAPVVAGELVPRFGNFLRGLHVGFYALLLVALNLCFDGLVHHIHFLEQRDPAIDGLPFALIHDSGWDQAFPHMRWTLFAIICAQSLTLAALYLNVREKRLRRSEIIFVIFSVVAMLGTSLANHLLQSSDVYSYVVNAHEGMTRSYTINTAIDDADLQRVTAYTWGTLPASPYGPLWHYYNGVIANVTPIATAVYHLRLLNIAAFLVLLTALIRAKAHQSTILLIALNPFFYSQFIVNAHNDLVPIALMAIAVAYSVKSTRLLVAASVTAGLIKVPLCLIGIASLVVVPSFRQRAVSAVVIVVFVVVLSLIFGGRPYLDALSAMSSHALTTGRLNSAMHIVAALIALGALGFSMLRGRRQGAGIFALATLGASVYPWYLAWMLPVCIAGIDISAPFLIAFPLLAFLISDVFIMPTILRACSYGLICVACIPLLKRTQADLRWTALDVA